MTLAASNTSDFTRAETMAGGQFAFQGQGGTIVSGGNLRAVPAGHADTIETRLGQAFSTAAPNAIIGGALPFRRTDPDHLWLSDEPRFRQGALTSSRFPQIGAELRTETSPQAYSTAVAKALGMMESEAGSADGLRKIVLARTLSLRTAQAIVPDRLMSRLGDDPAVTSFRVALPARPDAPLRCLVGATPELLLDKRGRRVLSNPLAGSARRAADPVADAAACAGLAQSDKDRREHAMVVEYILDTLAPWCRQLGCPNGTALTCTQSMWHLGTRIVGELIDEETSSATLAAMLHPTPAVCGLPLERAAGLIDELEPVERGFYTGAVGWCDGQGDGAWYVAIRCAEICGNEARLFAGAGIVPGSDPAAETAETGSKFAALLRAFDLPADAALTLAD